MKQDLAPTGPPQCSLNFRFLGLHQIFSCCECSLQTLLNSKTDLETATMCSMGEKGSIKVINFALLSFLKESKDSSSSKMKCEKNFQSFLYFILVSKVGCQNYQTQNFLHESQKPFKSHTHKKYSIQYIKLQLILIIKKKAVCKT